MGNKILYQAQVFLSSQPDAKIANGLFWSHFWLRKAYWLYSILTY